MILPIRTNIIPRRTPYVNYGLIAVNVLIFLISYAPQTVVIEGQRFTEPLRPWADIFKLYPDAPAVWQFISYAFLHGGVWHIVGNMFFLYIFGNNINDRLGNVGYLTFYLGGAVFSGIGHALIPGAGPVLGASGAVAAVTGAFLVLYPQTLITVIYFFFFIGTIDIPALYFIGLKMIFIDNVINRATPYVAYDAHLAGYAFGIITNFLLLASGLLGRDQFDLWSMIRQWNRRRQYRDVVSKGYDPFNGTGGRKKIKVREVGEGKSEADQEIERIRKQIVNLMHQRSHNRAAEVYTQLLEKDPNQVLARNHQLDAANQLMSMGKWAVSARAYELFLKHYADYDHKEQVMLMLGLLYSRYLDQPEKARELLGGALEKLQDPGQVRMCREEMDKLGNN